MPDLKLNIGDESWLRKMDAAFEKEDQYRHWLEDQNVFLSRIANGRLDELKGKDRALEQQKRRAEIWQSAAIAEGVLIVVGLMWAFWWVRNW